MRKDVKWAVIVVVGVVIVSKVIAYLPNHSNKGELLCQRAGGKVTARTVYSGDKLPIYKKGDILLTCVTDEEETIIDEKGIYICGSDERGTGIECYDVATEKRVL